MKKIINPVMCDVGTLRRARGFCKIDFKDGRLSITGVVGPRKNGNAYCFGQCLVDIRNGEPTKRWTKEMVEKFCSIWKEWHLNDMCPECEHQRALGWPELAREKVVIQKHGKETTEERGFIRFEEDDRGILCKPCPVCGYKYGTQWKKKEAPQDVIDFLMSLPETKVQPAWI